MAAQVDSAAPSRNRCADVAKENGAMRSALTSIFPPDLPVPRLEDSLQEFIESGAYSDLDVNVKIARKHARQAMKTNPGMTEDECAALTLYTMESVPREKSVYFVMNAALRAEDRTSVRPWRDFVWLLMHALRKCPLSPHVSVFRSAVCPFRCSVTTPRARRCSGPLFLLSPQMSKLCMPFSARLELALSFLSNW